MEQPSPVELDESSDHTPISNEIRDLKMSDARTIISQAMLNNKLKIEEAVEFYRT